ncbi:MAG: aldolase/citrate lyase family protein [Thermoguttaceae bacterium]|nr:aldolase/citrate lyase family protein [Thermoguttaceae bacterium]MDW8038785.1 aldolase/citrate lyase family protein [Thermoguttaceae bacterium]
MKTNPVKQKLRHGEASFGTWLSLGPLQAVRILARSGWDWLVLDMEHGPFDWSEAAIVCAAIADAGCVPLIRVPEGNVAYIKRALDAGAWGIVVPMVESVQQARLAIAAAKYPPEGIRSAGGGMHSLNFQAALEEYYLQANDQILVILQIESPQGVANTEAICQLAGFDALFIGPNDLRFRMRGPDGQFPSQEELEAAIQQVVQIGRKTGRPTGIHTMDPAEAKHRAEQGMQFLAVGSDLRMLALQNAAWCTELWPDRPLSDLAKY